LHHAETNKVAPRRKKAVINHRSPRNYFTRKVDHAAWDDDLFDDRLAVELLSDFGIGTCGGLVRGFIRAGRH
jgi:hypothetical protein